eukprot:TRINITY_DN25128_c0_g1_i3.p1 TRINITY_DN25128_c0_g1~~TRINITY_DN25128_c0_g1_i3.p1  ORF type:complete len:348 (+),score=71.77 TRINITY_DN25128_c0_g1_i3:213-1256(+)
MSRPHDGQRPFFPFGNPFRMILPKGSYISPKLLILLNTFEQTLAASLEKLNTNYNPNVLSLSWIKLAIESLCETHTSIKTLITELQFPVSDWDDKWIDLYLDNSVKLLDVCIAFSAEISRFNQGQLLLQYVLHILDSSSNLPSSEQLVQAGRSLHEWMQQICLGSPKLERLVSVLHGLVGSLYVSKVKNSSKGKVLMQAMYGVMVKTIFVCSVSTAAFTGSLKPLVDLHVSDKFMWSRAFNDLQANVNGEIRRKASDNSHPTLKELEAVYEHVEKLCDIIDGDGHKEAEILKRAVSGLTESSEALSDGLDLLSKDVEGFFQIGLTGRDALLYNLRASDLNQENNVEE